VRIALLFSVAALAACGNGNGGRCQTSAECQRDLACLPTGEGDLRLCLHTCDYDAGNGVEQHLCRDGLVCGVVEGMRVCTLGGTHPIDTACTSDVECESGTVCAPDPAGGMTCAQACTVGVDIPCSDTETCVPIAGGICRAPMIVLDGGTP
jgi:hypothetical protein